MGKAKSVDGGAEDPMGVAEGRLLADHDLAAGEVLLQGNVLQPLQEVRLAGSEVAGHQQPRELAALGALPGHLAQGIEKAALDGPLVRAQMAHRIAIGNPGAKGLDGPALCLVHGGASLTMGAKGLALARSWTSSVRRSSKAG